MIPLSLQAVRDAPVDYDLDPNGDIILELIYPETSSAAQAGMHIAFNNSHLSDSMIVHNGLSDVSEEDEGVRGHPSNNESGNSERARSPPVSYRAQRQRLCSASTFFKTLFLGPWFNNTYFELEGGIKLPLWEEAWDPEALLILLRIMHYQFSEIPQIIDLKLLEKIVITADYLKCIDFLRDFLKLWGADALSQFRRDSVLGVENDILVKDAIACTFISWKLCLREEFRMATRFLVLRTQCPIGNFGLPIDGSVIDTINMEREIILHQVIEPMKARILNLARRSLYALRREPRASIREFQEMAQYVRTVLGLGRLLQFPETPYISYSVAFVDRFEGLSVNFPGLDIDSF